MLTVITLNVVVLSVIVLNVVAPFNQLLKESIVQFLTSVMLVYQQNMSCLPWLLGQNV
jgi:hypothetical protein